MTALDAWVPALAKIEERMRRIGDGFGVEVALVWPLVGEEMGQELLVAAGSAHRVTVRPDWVFRYAIRHGATGIVLSHNHLRHTGPSAADRAVTRRLVAAGHLLDLPLLASLVIEPSVTHDLVSDRTWRSRASPDGQPSASTTVRGRPYGAAAASSRIESTAW